ncbi:urea carboxylase [Sideroxydans sp. CL21]|uniref:urea carboxylase n=1 Tax=Sideroxydans sp. CL21 TaxID=2600596 RepID=UPI0024BD42AF|nr:urea carboxylase [Sideroxydans sp. CL21]
MFNKVLIANRGAIACRIIRTLKRMGIRSVAVYSEADARSLHVQMADEAVCIGGPAAAESYLRGERILEVARSTGAQAIHPGYGFLSENAAFAEQCAEAGVVFIGPTPDQMRRFGLKHTAREIAEQNGVPLLPGSGLLGDAGHAHAEASRIGYPVMIKSTAGGGGIGMRLCWSADELNEAFQSVERLARANFKDAGIYLEKYVEHARHIEVQLFGDGRGQVIALGERDCSVQRRNQKVIEETPAPNLTPEVRKHLLETAVRLGEAVQYQSAGTVEFVFDAHNGEFYFLEVNTRLQVEHGVTEEVTGVDLVEWMVLQAAGELPDLGSVLIKPKGASIQVRLYAEDPNKNFQPSSGVLTGVEFSADARNETWVERGSDIPPYYDPMIAKIIVKAMNREAALEKMRDALADTRVDGIETNLEYLRQIVADRVFAEGRQTTRYLNGFHYKPNTIDVLESGVQSTLQDYPGRLGYWNIGVPPSGPMDALAFRLGNQLLGNAGDAAGLELTVSGPTLKFNRDTVIALTGAAMKAELDGKPLKFWRSHVIKAGSVLRLGAVQGGGCRTYLAVGGGFDVPDYLGSKSTFTLGQFGGHGGRTLRTGDVLHLGVEPPPRTHRALPTNLIPAYGNQWEIGVLYGPHGAPDFFTPSDIQTFFATEWEVHYNSSRTGVRLIGPKPEWARQDGGEAGLHPSNIHDNAYAIGAVDFTGDMPVILGPDGPSLGGFVCPVTIVHGELWKMGQLRPGDTVRFRWMTLEQANHLEQLQDETIAGLSLPRAPREFPAAKKMGSPVIHSIPAKGEQVQVVYRQSGDRNLLIEYGPLVLDINLRFRVHALMQWVQQAMSEGKLQGVLDLTPGIRSLQIHFDSRVMSRGELVKKLIKAEKQLPPISDMEVPTRIVHLPLSWDDPSTKLAIEKYMQSVRKDAPWCPSNIEFIRRINGIADIEQVKRIVFDASYLVLGLGDVYLGAPVATPLDPRHRLVTTKYNPARTWTPENAVGIGGAYMCVYGMEGPGGYQFVGRTVQMWNRYKQTADFEQGKPWLLRFFDQIRFYPVSEQELLKMREDFVAGRFQLKTEETTFSLKEYNQYLHTNDREISAFRNTQRAAFATEREMWKANGQAEYATDSTVADAGTDSELDLPPGSRAVTAHVAGNVWAMSVEVGSKVRAGDTLVVIESMKMEIAVLAPCDGEILQLNCRAGGQVSAGQDLLVIHSDE